MDNIPKFLWANTIVSTLCPIILDYDFKKQRNNDHNERPTYVQPICPYMEFHGYDINSLEGLDGKIVSMYIR